MPVLINRDNNINNYQMNIYKQKVDQIHTMLKTLLNTVDVETTMTEDSSSNTKQVGGLQNTAFDTLIPLSPQQHCLQPHLHGQILPEKDTLHPLPLIQPNHNFSSK
jgi:hypothetical protein